MGVESCNSEGPETVGHVGRPFASKAGADKYLFLSTVTRTNEFKQFMQNYVYHPRDSAITISFDPNCTWEAVKLEAAKVIDEYNGKGNSWKNPFRSAGRISGNAISALEFLIVLLPQGEYSSILCGALKLVYSVSLGTSGHQFTVSHKLIRLLER
jgi:hypothetical protein